MAEKEGEKKVEEGEKKIEKDKGKEKVEEKQKDKENEEDKEKKDVTESTRKESLSKEGSAADSIANKGDEEVPEEVQLNPVYHGLVPQEDLCFILSEAGDFLIRSTQIELTRKFATVISVQTSKNPAKIKHIRIHRERKKDDKVEWYASEKYKYGSLKELIDDYIKQKRPIHPQLTESILVNGITLMNWEFRHSEIKLGKLLGEGQFASVHYGEIIAGPLKKSVAIKKALLTKTQESKGIATEVYREFMHEARLMRIFNHPNIAKCHGIAVIKLPMLIILELIDGGAIYGYLRKNQNKIPDEEKISNMCYGTARGLKYLHENKCIHRDIASRNAKISDFGLSRIGDVYSMKKGKKIPIKWTAPETVAALVYTQKSDVYSYSIFMWEVFTDGDEPYEGLTHMEVRQRVGCGARLDRPKHCPKSMFFLMKKCWEQNPDERYTMKKVVEFMENYLRKRKKRKDGDVTEMTMATVRGDNDEADENDEKNEDEMLDKTKADSATVIKELRKKIEKLRAIAGDSSQSSEENIKPKKLERGEETSETLTGRRGRPRTKSTKRRQSFEPRRAIIQSRSKNSRTQTARAMNRQIQPQSRSRSWLWPRNRRSKERIKSAKREKLSLKPEELHTMMRDMKRIKKQFGGEQKQ